MVFSSPTFLFLFLPLTLLAYLATPARWRNATLLVASVIFYIWGSGIEVFVLLYVGLVSYAGVRITTGRAARSEAIQARRARRYMDRHQRLATLAEPPALNVPISTIVSPHEETSAARDAVGASGRSTAVLTAPVVTSPSGPSGLSARPPGPDVAQQPPMVSRGQVAVLIGLLLIPIIVFKYVPPVSLWVHSLGYQGAPELKWALPLGISFFTFHAVSYVVDCTRRGLPIEYSLRDYLLYLFLFPHQIAGPIVRFKQIVTELKDRREVTLDNIGYGMTRFAWGLFKKACIADSVGVVADAAFASAGPGMSTANAWTCALAYTVQIYFDFSGYSDMAIGLAAVFGFVFPENFNSPYRSTGPADFWRRWHITLSSWFRDYVYIPFGGNRHGVAREYAGLLLTFFLTALWHGAAWTFLVWGGVHSAGLLLERITGLRKRTGFMLLRRILMVVFIIASWVPFRATSLREAIRIWHAMFSAVPGPPAPQVILALTPWTLVSIGIGLLIFFGPRSRTGFALIHGQRSAFRYPIAIVTAPLLLVVAVISVFWLDFSPFLYFQF